MTHRSPLITLAGLVVAFAIMLVANLINTAGLRTAGGQPAVSTPPSAAAPSTAPPTSAPPGPTESATASAPSTVAPSKAAKPSDYPNKVVYAGRTKDGKAAIAVAVLGDQAAAYFCDGRSIESWLRGTIQEDEIKLASKKGAKLEVRLKGKAITGTLELNDHKYTFESAVAQKPAGLYRAKGSKTTIGWIVLPNGTQVGIATSGDASAAAPTLDPANPTVTTGGEQLQAAPVTGDEDL